jgi:hypothetical protein
VQVFGEKALVREGAEELAQRAIPCARQRALAPPQNGGATDRCDQPFEVRLGNERVLQQPQEQRPGEVAQDGFVQQ